MNPLPLGCVAIAVICGIWAATDIRTLFAKRKEDKIFEVTMCESHTAGNKKRRKQQKR